MASKGGEFLRGLVAKGSQLLGHGPKCAADCSCRLASTFANLTVGVLEEGVRESKRRKALEGAKRTRSVPKANPRALPQIATAAPSRGAARAEIIDAEVIEGEPVRGAQVVRVVVTPRRALPLPKR